MVSFGKETVGNLKIASRKEWLLTNGIGGYASSTIIGCNTRRYHGLLVAATKPPLGRMVLLSKLEEIIGIEEASYQLSTNRYPKTIHPQGYLLLQGFKMDPFPKFIFSVENIIVEKEIAMVRGENTTIITYRIYNSGRAINFVASPLIACRDSHWLMREDKEFNPSLEVKNSTINIRPYLDTPTIYIQGKDLSFIPGGCWYHSFEYEVERARGLDFIEDLYDVGYFMTSVKGEAEFSIIASDKPINKGLDIERIKSEEKERIQKIIELSGAGDEIETTLVKASDCFIVDRKIKAEGEGETVQAKTILAGYHWLSDWGRDAMVALEGLTLITKRYSDARAILTNFAKNSKGGLIPNNFPEWGEKPQFNSMDASLWFIMASYKYLAATGDLEFINKTLFKKLEEIISSYKKGIDFGISMDEDGLIYSNENRYRLTWIDSRNEELFIPARYGKVVEVQALWFNVLMMLDEISSQLGMWNPKYKELAEKVRESFCKKFWCTEEGYLFDCIWKNKVDSSLKPSQIIAVGLPFSILPRDREKNVVEIIHKKLFTPLGIKDFTKTFKDSSQVQKNDFSRRDNSFHQVNIWVWLMGYFIEAYLKVNDNSITAITRAKMMLEPLFEHIKDTGVGFLSEYFDGNEPYAPKGCIAQAWSVAELLRIKKILEELERSQVKQNAYLRIPV